MGAAGGISRTRERRHERQISAPQQNPIFDDPAVELAREEVADGIGQWLAVYAVARAKEALHNPLGSIGAPLLDVVLKTVDRRPVSVTAMRVTGPNGLEHWSLVVAFDSGLRASIDIGGGLGSAQSTPLDLRIEWSGTERTILVDPANVSVTVRNGSGASSRTAEVSPISKLLEVWSWDPANQAYYEEAMAVEAAARRSLETGAPVQL